MQVCDGRGYENFSPPPPSLGGGVGSTLPMDWMKPVHSIVQEKIALLLETLLDVPTCT